MSFEKELMIDRSAQQPTATLKLSGELTIQHAAALKESLLEALSTADRCFLDVSQVRQFDLSGLQLLYAAHLSSNEQNKSFMLLGDYPESLKSAVLDVGFENIDWFHLEEQ